MQENKRNIDDFLRDELGSYAETPPPAVWEDLEQRLDASRPGDGLPFRRWWWIIPVLFFLTGVVFLAANNTNTHTAKTKRPVADNNTGAPGALQAVPDRKLPDARPDTSSPVHPGSHTGKKSIPAGTIVPVQQVTGADTAVRKAASLQKPGNKTFRQHTAVHHNTKNINAGDSSAPAVTVGTGVKAAAKHTTHKSGRHQAATAVVSAGTVVAPAASAAMQPSAGKKHTAPHSAKRQAIVVSPASVGQSKDTGNNQPVAGSFVATAAGNKLPGKTHRRDRKKWAANALPASPAGRTQAVAPDSKDAGKKKRAVKPADNGNKDTGTLTAAGNESKQPVTVRPAKEGKKKPLVVKPAKNSGRHPETAVTAVKPERKGTKQLRASAAGKGRKYLTTPKTGSNNSAAAVDKPVKKTREASSAAGTLQKKQPTGNIPEAAARKKKATAGEKTVQAPVQPVVPATGNRKSSATGNSGTQTKGAVAAHSPEISVKAPQQDSTESDAGEDMDTDTADREMDPYASLHPPKEKQRPHFEAGVKAAYSYGFTPFALNKITAMPYVQLNINARLSVLLHLGFSYGQMSKTDLADWQSYYKITNSSFSYTTTIDSITQDTAYHYTYHQSRDSFAAKYAVTKTIWETELPVLLKYRLGGGFSVFGGPVFTFGKIVQITETKSSATSFQLADTLSSHTLYGQSFFDSRHRPAGQSDTVYTSNALQYQNPSSTPLRVGYMLGFSYDAGHRITVDLSVQQMLSGASYIPNPDIRKTYTSPYVRLSVGFKVFK